MQITGVYRNCKCDAPMWVWGAGRGGFQFVISSNTAEMIYYAKLYWLPTGIASICLLIAFCYMGWWYQRHWRQRFKKIVDDVLMTAPKRPVKKAGHPKKAVKGKDSEHLTVPPTGSRPGSKPASQEMSSALQTSDDGKKETSKGETNVSSG